MQTIIIGRFQQDDKQTLGDLNLYSPQKKIFSCKTIELPWKENKRRVSRISTGSYIAIKHESPKFGECLWIQNVPERSEILIHVANFVRDLLGCIGVGKEHIDIDKDGYKDVTSSKNTISELMSLVDDKIRINIVNVFNEAA